jgi:hypothetical protein
VTNNPNNPQDALTRRANAIELEGRHRFGEEHWAAGMAALARANPQGIEPQDANKLLNGPDAAGEVWKRQGDALLDQADARYSTTASPEERLRAIEADRAYNRRRQSERDAHNSAKGRR